jgi:hypothetical protein
MVNGWRSYNAWQVRRVHAQVMLDFDFIDRSHDEVEKTSEDKGCTSFRYIESFVQLLGYVLRYFHLPTGRLLRCGKGAHPKKKKVPFYPPLRHPFFAPACQKGGHQH